MEPLTKLLSALASRPWPAVFAIVIFIFMLLGPLKKLIGMLAPAGTGQIRFTDEVGEIGVQRLTKRRWLQEKGSRQGSDLG
jgi:hypothetical protein